MLPIPKLASCALSLSRTSISAAYKASFESEDGRFRHYKLEEGPYSSRILLLQRGFFTWF